MHFQAQTTLWSGENQLIVTFLCVFLYGTSLSVVAFVFTFHKNVTQVFALKTFSLGISTLCNLSVRCVETIVCHPIIMLMLQ